jgi:hypothetical protein
MAREQLGVALRLALARLAILIEPTNLGGQPFEPVAAVVGDVLLEFASSRAAPGAARRSA